jgi:hypothetical protein
MFSKLCFLSFVGILATTNACNQTANQAAKQQDASFGTLTPLSAPDFNNYWYAGKAELSTYAITQERYGELRNGEQVNIYVTEDLSASKQVKLDNAEAAGADKVPVLKLNSVRRFETGIYDYSFMSSVFTPIDRRKSDASLKYTCTVQDWCGHTFTQMNRLDKAWRWRQFSYFEQEADADVQIDDCMLEDELWTHLRLNPIAFTDRKLNLLPGGFYLRMRHLPATPTPATAKSTTTGDKITTTIQYETLPRTITVVQEAKFPYRMTSWEETDKGKVFLSAKLKKIVHTDYWAKHDNVHTPWRDSLGMNQ